MSNTPKKSGIGSRPPSEEAGVYKNASSGKWVAYLYLEPPIGKDIDFERDRVDLGLHDTRQQALAARQAAKFLCAGRWCPAPGYNPLAKVEVNPTDDRGENVLWHGKTPPSTQATAVEKKQIRRNIAGFFRATKE